MRPKPGTLYRTKRKTMFFYDLVEGSGGGFWLQWVQDIFPKGTILLYLGIETFSKNGVRLHSFLGSDSKKYYKDVTNFSFNCFKKIKT